MEQLLELWNQLDVGWNDILDITVVSYVIYQILKAFRGTRAMPLLQGVAVFLAVVVLARWLDLRTVNQLLNLSLFSLVVLIPVVFQPELRRFFIHLGRQGLLSQIGLNNLEEDELDSLVEEVSFAAASLSRLRYGALIVLEQDTGLEDYLETGQPIDASVSAKLLISIFNPKSPLHDGAVIIRGNRIAGAACYLDLTEERVDDRFGTRHRAALGTSEQSDCLVIVVSEETGEVRIARDGKFTRPTFEQKEIRKLLIEELDSQKAARAEQEAEGEENDAE